jgi:hypothetical protein
MMWGPTPYDFLLLITFEGKEIWIRLPLPMNGTVNTPEGASEVPAVIPKDPSTDAVPGL